MAVRLAVIVLLGGVACNSPESISDQSAAPAQDPERELVLAFWKAYREATRLRLSGDFEAALHSYELALKHDASHEDALYYTGNVAVELGKWSDAESAWIRLIDVNPASSRAYNQLGLLFLCRPQTDRFSLSRAQTAFREAVRLNREETGTLLRLGEVYLAAGKLDSAVVFLDAVLSSNPSSDEARFVRSYVHWLRGNETAAMSLIDARPSSVAHPSTLGMSGEGDTRGGTGPMLAPGAGCPLFEPFGELLAADQSRAAVVRNFDMLEGRLRAVSKAQIAPP